MGEYRIFCSTTLCFVDIQCISSNFYLAFVGTSDDQGSSFRSVDWVILSDLVMNGFMEILDSVSASLCLFDRIVCTSHARESLTRIGRVCSSEYFPSLVQSQIDCSVSSGCMGCIVVLTDLY